MYQGSLFESGLFFSQKRFRYGLEGIRAELEGASEAPMLHSGLQPLRHHNAALRAEPSEACMVHSGPAIGTPIRERTFFLTNGV